MPIRKQILRALRSGPSRRSLFGPVDHDELQNDHQDLMQGNLEEASRRWGFNFQNDTPIEGSDFFWEAVPAAQVPELYRPSAVDKGNVQRLSGAAVEAVEKASVTTQCMEKMPEGKLSCAVKRKQTNMTDFYQAKRRAVSIPRKSGQ